MSTRIRISVIAALLLVCGAARSGEEGHFVNGTSGLKCASAPPPGNYYLMYNLYYHADELKDEDGDDVPVDFDVDVFANIHRFIHITDKKILGGNYGWNAIAAVVNTDLEIDPPGIDDEQTDIDDLYIEPFMLCWNRERFDACFGYAVYLPTGPTDTHEPAHSGKDFWTHMFTFGGTYYFDKPKSWTASVLGRWQIHSEKDDEDIRPGQDLSFEWGLTKTVVKAGAEEGPPDAVVDLGASGYCHWQVTDDSGDDVVWDEDVHDRAFGAGPEIRTTFPKWKVQVSLKHWWDFAVEDRAEGARTVLTLTKIF